MRFPLYMAAAAALATFSCSDAPLTRADCEAGHVKSDGLCVQVVGRPCSGTTSCFGGTCINDSIDTYCSMRCANSDDCPPAYLCSLSTGENYCVKDRQVIPGKCSRDGDCGKCGLCFQGVCRSSDVCINLLCDTDEDCGKCKECYKGACRTRDDCGPPCSSQNDCQPGFICAFDFQGELACILNDAGTFGHACSKFDGSECKTRICLAAPGVPQNYSGYCSRQCDVSDASSCPPGYSCRAFPPFAKEDTYCIKPSDPYFPEFCDSTVGCQPWLQCNFSLRADGSGIVTFCGDQEIGKKWLGQVCTSDADCNSGGCSQSYVCSVPCADDLECPTGYACRSQKNSDLQNQMTFRGCLPYMLALASFGDPCPGGDLDCTSGICLPGAAIGPLPYCTAECIDDRSCPADHPSSCLPSGDGRNLCLYDAAGLTCRADSDCGPGKACSLWKDQGNAYYTLACRTTYPEEGKPGEKCNLAGPAMPCTAGILCSEDSICMAFCRSTADCPNGAICDWKAHGDIGGKPGVTLECVPDPGSQYRCTSDKNCMKDSGESCRISYDRELDQYIPRCRIPLDSMKEYGEACDNGRQCPSGLCIHPSASDPVNVCTRLCESNADCVPEPDHFCRPLPVWDADWNPYFVRSAHGCAALPAQGEIGTRCKEDGDCGSGFCASDLSGSSFCSVRCRGNEDCLESLTLCRWMPAYGYICTPPDYFPGPY